MNLRQTLTRTNFKDDTISIIALDREKTFLVGAEINIISVVRLMQLMQLIQLMHLMCLVQWLEICEVKNST